MTPVKTLFLNYFFLFFGFYLLGFNSLSWAEIKEEAAQCGPLLRASQLFHKNNPSLHTSLPVTLEQQRRKRAGEKTSLRPHEKIFVWMQLLERIHIRSAANDAAKERLRHYYYKKFVTRPQDIPESYFENQKKLARERGQGEMEITPTLRKQRISSILSDQEKSLDQWFDYLLSSDTESYPFWAKYWAFTGVVQMAGFDPERGQFIKRGKQQIAPFPELNREAFAKVIDTITTNNEGQSFAKLYGLEISKLKAQQLQKEANLSNSVDGVWVKYPQGSDPALLIASLQGHATGWCTAAGAAVNQLANGDFHVYYSIDSKGSATVPRIAIRFESAHIVEVRGTAKNQHLDSKIAQTEILSKKLELFGAQGKRFEKASSHMQRLTLIEKKWLETATLSKEDLRFLYEIDEKIEAFGFSKDPRITQILEKRDKRSDLASLLQIEPSQISLTEEEALSGNIRYHFGDLNLQYEDLNKEKITLPQMVSGDLDLRGLVSVKKLTLPESVGGSLDLGDLISPEGLTLPQRVGQSLQLRSLSSTKALILPQTVGNYLDLSGLVSAEGLTLPQSLGGSLNMWRLRTAEGLILPQSINGDLDLLGLTSAKGLVLPQSVTGDLNLNGLISAEGLTFPKRIGGSLRLNGLTSAKGLILPLEVDGNIDLLKVPHTENLSIPLTIKGQVRHGILGFMFKKKSKPLRQ